MNRLIDPVRRHPVVAYVALAWALAWAYWIPMALRGDVATPGGSVSHFPGLLSPMVAAIAVTAVIRGRAGLRDFGARLLRWRVSPRWYAFAALPYLVFLGALALVAIAGGELPAASEYGEFSGLPALAVPLVFLLVLAFNGYGEEAGWRGFLTPELLRRRGPFVTSLIVGLVWFAWHVPSFWAIETYRLMGLAIIPMMGIGLLSGAIILTWLYVGSGGSVLIVALWHVALNFGSATAAGRGAPGVVVWNAMLLWAIVVIVAWIVAGEPRTRPFMTRLRDGSLIALLRSPLGRFMPGMTVIGFRGRRSGRTLRTPVECVRDAGRVYVLVGQADRKQWWRNVMADPAVTVEIEGRDVPGRAAVHVGGPEAEEDMAAYLRRRPGAARVVGQLAEPMPNGVAATAGPNLAWVRIDVAAPA